jgi:hypothetical protein
MLQEEDQWVLTLGPLIFGACHELTLGVLIDSTCQLTSASRLHSLYLSWRRFLRLE